ncbi:hypothetical protein [Rummeliibacillus sp. TYF-LIM-RU47]|uniref:hypothetical protein n=1 Tax=Rummeliibacillus sp. TYF-LIM-RU47 TaxID=2608406 RepID=UPI00123C1FAA|nr:hypothetical protein [Rummeliibacillus sp. TYF-LIM-RU47]
MPTVEIIGSVVLIAITVLLMILGIEKKKKNYYKFSFVFFIIYILFVIYLIIKNGINIFMIIQHAALVLAIICCYLLENDENERENKIANVFIKILPFLALLMVFMRD